MPNLVNPIPIWERKRVSRRVYPDFYSLGERKSSRFPIPTRESEVKSFIVSRFGRAYLRLKGGCFMF